MRPRKRYLIPLLFCFCWAFPVIAQEPDQKESDPQVEIRAPKGHAVGKILLFPLKLPRYVIKFATFPIATAGRFIERHKVAERAINLLSNEEKTFWVYPIIEIGAGSGLGGGLGLRHSDLFHQGYHLGANFRLFTDLDIRTGASFGDPEAFTIAGETVAYTIKGRFTKESDEDFFGIGNNSLKANSSEFAFSDITAGVEFDYSFAKHWHVSPELFFTTAKTKTSGGTTPPSVEALFPVATLGGFDRWTRHLVIGLNISHDTRDASARPESGGLRKISFRRYQGVGQSGFDYNEYGVDMRQYFRLWAPRRVFVLKNAWTFLQETGSSTIPFYRLATLDINSPLRGFDRGRFRDSASVIFNAEYRYPVWDFIDGTIFVDTGRVFDDPSDFSFKDFKYSVGGGIRMLTRNFFLFRIQAAYGGEGVNILFKVTQAL